MTFRKRASRGFMLALLAFTATYIGQQRALAIAAYSCCCDSGCNTCNRSLKCPPNSNCSGAYPTCCTDACGSSGE